MGRANNTKKSGRAFTDHNTELNPIVYRRLVWLIGLVAWGLVTASLLSHDPTDAPGHAAIGATRVIHNWIGPAGAVLSYNMFSMFGVAAWLLVAWAGVYLFHVAFRGPIDHPVVRTLGVCLVGLALSSFHALLFSSWSTMPEGGGGLLAIAGSHLLSAKFGTLGAVLWMVLLGIVGLTVAFDKWLVVAPKAMAATFGFAARSPIGAVVKGAPGMLAARLASVRENDLDDDNRLSNPAAVMIEAKARRERAKAEAAIGEDEGGLGGVGAIEGLSAKNAKGSKSAKQMLEEEIEEAEELEDLAEEMDESEEGDDLDDAEVEAEAADVDEDDGGESEESEGGALESKREFTPEELRAKIAKLPIRFASENRETATTEDLEQLRAVRANEEVAEKNYVFPGLDLLENPEEGYSKELEKLVREQAEALEGALRTYGISGEVAGIESGPVVTLYHVRLAPGTKVNAITSVSSDLARALKSVNIRVVSNMEGTDTVGIEVPNRLKEKVRLKELMTKNEITSKMKLPLFLGKDSSGRPLISDLASMPHLLIAGTTGSGKSVAMNTIIMGFLYTLKPSDLKLVLVDPKMVEMSQFKDIPHLMCPVVTDMNKAAAILEWAVTKMDERYELLSEAGCRDIAAYNSMAWEELKERFNPQNEVEEAKIPRKLPYMVFIIDELADLMMTNKEVESSIVRIAQKARAVGIHLVLATQRPQANVVTGLIKSNMPGRISFKVASGMDSRIVLDMKGGELLLGQGDMLMLTPRSTNPIRAQGTLVDDREIRRVVKFVKEVSSPSFERSLLQLRSDGTSTPEDHEQKMLESAQEDPLFDRAVEIVLETGRGSVSLLQRRLAIGYTRASRLVELMGIAGIIGEYKGSVAREVVITIEEWQAMKAQAEADKASGGGAGGASAGKPSQGKLFKDEEEAKPVRKPHHEADDALPASTATLPTREEAEAGAGAVREAALSWKSNVAESEEMVAVREEEEAKTFTAEDAESAEEEEIEEEDVQAEAEEEPVMALEAAEEEMVESIIESKAVTPEEKSSAMTSESSAEEVAEEEEEVIEVAEEEEEAEVVAEKSEVVEATKTEDAAEEEEEEEYEYVEVDPNAPEAAGEDGEYEYVYEEVEVEVDEDEAETVGEAAAEAKAEEPAAQAEPPPAKKDEGGTDTEIKTLPFGDRSRESAA
ncbi:MAG TPA: DNA translocase FtsK [Phycisphaerales bacterium]|nr:DNA translocase FtsK [Phycisphaerales bacterium]